MGSARPAPSAARSARSRSPRLDRSVEAVASPRAAPAGATLAGGAGAGGAGAGGAGAGVGGGRLGVGRVRGGLVLGGRVLGGLGARRGRPASRMRTRTPPAAS